MRAWKGVLCFLAGLLWGGWGLAGGLTPPKPFGALAGQFLATAGSRWSDRAAQAWAESGFNARAVSPVGARGLCQFMPGTWGEMERQRIIPAGSDPFDPNASIRAQHGYMLQLEAQMRGWLGPCPKDGGWFDAALGGYNAGPGSIKKALRLARAMGDDRPEAWKATLPRVTGPHAPETLGYVPKIMRFRSALEALP